MDRGTVPAVGVVLLVAVTVITAATVGVVVATETPERPPTASFDVSADGSTGEVSLTHQGGDPIDLEQTEIQLEIDGQSLDSQPPVPYFAAEGFVGSPAGPFNSASSDTWRPGETGAIAIASTNEPRLTPGATVTVTIIVEGTVIAELSTGA